MAKNNIIRDYTKGPIWWPMVLFALPFMLSNGLQVLYSVVDMLIVGQFLGKVGVAAVSNAGRIFIFLTMVCLGLSLSGQIYISQLIGQGERGEKINKTIGTYFFSQLVIGAIMTVIGLLLTDWIIAVLEVPSEAIKDARSYLRITTAGLVFSYGYNMISGVLRGMGNSRHPFVFIAIASVINIVLDFVFIKYCGLGVFGAGLATILGQAIAFIYAFIFLYCRRQEFGFDFKLKSFIPSSEIFNALMKLGVPYVIRFASINVSMLYVIRLINKLGVNEATVFGAGVQLDDIVTKVTLGIMMAGTAMVGQNYGARQFARINKIVSYAWLFSASFYVVFASLLLMFPKQLIGMFTNEPEVVALAPVFAYSIAWQFPGLVLMRGTNSFLNGIGHAKLGLIFALLDGVVLRIGLSWFFGMYLGMGFRGFVLGYGVACYGMGVPALIYYLFFPWKNRKLVTES